jgi:hypothetical protein
MREGFIKTDWLKMTIAFSVLSIAASLSYYLISASLNNESAPDVEILINRSLPPSVLLREYKKIPNTHKNSYLGIYISDYSIAKLENKTNEFYYSSCPEQTMGQSATGRYHLFLFEDNHIVDDVIIPSPGYYEDDKMSLSFNNTKENNADFFGGEKPSDADKFDIEKTELIHFYDYSGDGLEYEFLLVGDKLACGHVNYLVAGYDEVNNKVVVYKIKLKDNLVYWYDNFKPDNSGNTEVTWLCGDHGSQTESRDSFSFDNELKIYVLRNSNEKACD